MNDRRLLELWDARFPLLKKTSAVLIALLAKPRSPFLFMLGFLLGLGGILVRLWAAAQVPPKAGPDTRGPYACVRHPDLSGALAVSYGLAAACTSFRHPLSTTLFWAAAIFLQLKLLPLLAARREPSLSSRAGVPAFIPRWPAKPKFPDGASFELSRALAQGAHRDFASLLAMALLLRVKLTYLL